MLATRDCPVTIPAMLPGVVVVAQSTRAYWVPVPKGKQFADAFAITCPLPSVQSVFAIVPLVNNPLNVMFPVAPIVVKLADDAVVPPIAPGEAKVAPLSEEAFKFATFVVLVTENGAVPVAMVEVNAGAVIPLVKVCAGAPR